MKPSIQDLINARELADDDKLVLQRILIQSIEKRIGLTEPVFSNLIKILEDENCPSSIKIDLSYIEFTFEQFRQILEALLNNPRLTNRMLSIHSCFNESPDDPLIQKQVVELLSNCFKNDRIPANFCLDLSANIYFTTKELKKLGKSLILYDLPENLSLKLCITDLSNVI